MRYLPIAASVCAALFAETGVQTLTGVETLTKTEEQGNRGRAEMMRTSFREYETRIRDQFTQMFAGAGFDAQRDIAGIILNRWGHAYLSPQPGFFFGKDGKPAPREILRNAPFGRIAFANTDLAGAMDHRYPILEAKRAVEQLLDQVLTWWEEIHRHLRLTALLYIAASNVCMPKTQKRDAPDELKGWEQIAAFLGQPVSVAERWAETGMPIEKRGLFVYSSREQLNHWLGCESAWEPVQIATAETDLSSELKRGLSYVRKQAGTGPKKKKAA